VTVVFAVTAVYIQQLKGSTIKQMVISGQNLASTTTTTTRTRSY